MKTPCQCPPALRAAPPRGFSLIELLVAMAITAIIMLVLLSLVGQSTTSYTQTQRAVNTLSQARAFLQFFDREISTRLPRTPLIHEKGSGSGANSSDKIAFVRAISLDEQTSATPGDLGTSIYYVDFTTEGSNPISPKLFRKTLNPEETQTLIETAGNPAFPAVSPANDEPIIPNVLKFEAKPKYRDGSGKLKDWTKSSPEPPAVIELTIQFIDDSSSQRFRSQADWDRLATAPRDTEVQLIRTYNRSIAIAK